jgi:2,4-diaminopentanoate dehydrogenase
MSANIRVLHMGLGPIGIKTARLIAQRKRASIVAAIDINPKLQQKALGELIDNPAVTTTITNDLETAIAAAEIDIALVTTTSSAASLFEQIKPLIFAGIPVITTCEELLYPWNTQAELAENIHRTAQQYGCAILGTGVNPGFLMDYLPAISTGLTQHIESVTINRIQDASIRRRPFQIKIGAGLSLDAFAKKVEDGSLKHVGLPESVHYLAHVLGLQLDQVVETIKPVLSTPDQQAAEGVHQQALGMIGDKRVIELNFIASMHHRAPEDRIIIKGEPNFNLSFNPPINGDIATTAVTVNSIPSLLAATPGLHTMGSIEPIRHWQ